MESQAKTGDVLPLFNRSDHFQYSITNLREMLCIPEEGVGAGVQVKCGCEKIVFLQITSSQTSRPEQSFHR